MAGNPLISSFWHFDPPKAWPRLPGFLVNFECVQFVHPTLCHLFLEVEVRLPIHIQKTSWISWAIVEQTNERVAATFGQWRMLTGLCEVDPTVVWWGLTHNTVHTWRRLRTLILSPLGKAWIASIGNQCTPAGWPMAQHLEWARICKMSLSYFSLLFKIAHWTLILLPQTELPGDERCFGIWSYALSVLGGYKRLQRQRRGDTNESMFCLSVSAEALFEPWGVCGCLGMPFSQTAEEAQKTCADISGTKEKVCCISNHTPICRILKIFVAKRTFKIGKHFLNLWYWNILNYSETLASLMTSQLVKREAQNTLKKHDLTVISRENSLGWCKAHLSSAHGSSE